MLVGEQDPHHLLIRPLACQSEAVDSLRICAKCIREALIGLEADEKRAWKFLTRLLGAPGAEGPRRSPSAALRERSARSPLPKPEARCRPAPDRPPPREWTHTGHNTTVPGEPRQIEKHEITHTCTRRFWTGRHAVGERARWGGSHGCWFVQFCVDESSLPEERLSTTREVVAHRPVKRGAAALRRVIQQGHTRRWNHTSRIFWHKQPGGIIQNENGGAVSFSLSSIRP